jgi:hypothetical protein
VVWFTIIGCITNGKELSDEDNLYGWY